MKAAVLSTVPEYLLEREVGTYDENIRNIFDLVMGKAPQLHEPPHLLSDIVVRKGAHSYSYKYALGRGNVNWNAVDVDAFTDWMRMHKTAHNQPVTAIKKFSIEALRLALNPANTKNRCVYTYLSNRDRGTASDMLTYIRAFGDPLSVFEQYKKPNWDGYGAHPIAQETIDTARSIYRMLPAEWDDPALAPSADGSIGFEWDREDGPIRTLFLDVGPGKVWRAYWRTASGDRRGLPRQAYASDTGTVLAGMFRQLSV